VLTERYVDVVERDAADLCLVKLVQRLAARLARGDPEAPEVPGQVSRPISQASAAMPQP
jgi:hypothetical protein